MELDKVRDLLRKAKSVAVLAGAGLSAESGIPTFRGAAGLWNNVRPEDLATPDAFFRNPNLVWEWYDWRRGLIAKADPNAGHRALGDLERQTKEFTLVTQNVDGLSQRAGSRRVIEIHGSIWKLRCTRCVQVWEDLRVPLPIPARCECGALARPGVVWFGESLPEDAWKAAEEAAASCDVFLVVGTSAVVYPASGLVGQAQSARAKVIEVNSELTQVSSRADYVLTGKAGEVLPRLVEAFRSTV